MTTKTREEAIEEVKRRVEIQQKNTGLCGQLEYTDRSVFARCFKGGEFFNVVEEFTPPKPEFEKGTIGLDEYTAICFYKELNIGGNYVVCSHEKNVNGKGGYTAGTFTPVYQTDPVETRAFELTCGKIGGEMGCARCTISKFCGDQKGNCYEVIQAYFKSKAKEELSK